MTTTPTTQTCDNCDRDREARIGLDDTPIEAIARGLIVSFG